VGGWRAEHLPASLKKKERRGRLRKGLAAIKRREEGGRVFSTGEKSFVCQTAAQSTFLSQRPRFLEAGSEQIDEHEESRDLTFVYIFIEAFLSTAPQ
jgi:hypothetical protein